MHVGERDEFSVVVTTEIEGSETIVGEAPYAFHPNGKRADSACRSTIAGPRHRIGAAAHLECSGAALGAQAPLFGDTLHSERGHDQLSARKSGFTFTANPDDWKLVRFVKQIDTSPQDIPCASSRLAATGIAGGVTANASVCREDRR